MFKAEEEGRQKRGLEDSYAVESGDRAKTSRDSGGPLGCSVRLSALFRHLLMQLKSWPGGCDLEAAPPCF